MILFVSLMSTETWQGCSPIHILNLLYRRWWNRNIPSSLALLLEGKKGREGLYYVPSPKTNVSTRNCSHGGLRFKFNNKKRGNEQTKVTHRRPLIRYPFSWSVPTALHLDFYWYQLIVIPPPFIWNSVGILLWNCEAKNMRVIHTGVGDFRRFLGFLCQ